MFKLKFPASTSSPSLSVSPTTPKSSPNSAGLPHRSSSNNALSALQQQRQQHRNNQHSPALLSARVRSNLPLSPHQPLSPSTSSLKTTDQEISPPLSSLEAQDGAVMSNESSMNASQSSLSLSGQSFIVPAIEEDDWNGGPAASQNVVVCVRVRPGGKDCNEELLWSMDAENNRITPTDQHPSIAKRSGSSSFSKSSLLSPTADSGDSNEFRFDSLVLPSMNTSSMYEANISPIIDAVVGGYNGTVFAYGQTGSGKTHTMSGSDSEKGVIPRAVEEIFEKVEKAPQREFLLRVSYLEIYNESLKDLLAPYPSSTSSTDLTARPSSPIKGGSSHVSGGGDASSLRILESGGKIQIQGIREEIVTNPAEVLNLIEWGQRGRHQAATDWNERSSRSHCVFMLTVESRDRSGGSSPPPPSSGKDNVRFSQLNLIDLAGSERAASEKERRKEGAFINKSLLTLGTVIAKLSEQCQTGEKDAHIPYRDSKLTRLLQTSLGGNARVAVVCTLSPKKEHGVESMSTLRFGQRCKMVVTKAKRGTIMNDKALIARYRKELERLRSQLEQGSGAIAMAETSVMPVLPENVGDETMRELLSKREEAENDVRMMNEKRDDLKKQVEHLTRLILTGKDVAAEGQSHHRDESDHDNGTTTASARARRAGRMSDLGTSSPSKRAKMFDGHRQGALLARDSIDQENAGLQPSHRKPFALEGEMAALRKSLSNAMASKKASEEARMQETQLWRARVMELEASNTEQEEELDEAEAAFEKVKNDRDTLRGKLEEEIEGNRLLKLVAQSRGATDSSRTDEDDARSKSEESDEKVRRLEGEREMELERGQEARRERDEVLVLLRKAEEEGRSKSNQILALQQQLESLTSSQRDRTSPSILEQVVENLKAQLAQANEAREQAQRELQSATLEHNQEDAERDFADLVKVEGGTVAQLKRDLSCKERLLEEKSREVQLLQKEVKDAKQTARTLPAPSMVSTPLPDTLRSVMEQQIRLSDQRSQALEEQVNILKGELEARSLSYLEIDRQASQIASLERRLAEAGSSRVMPRSPLKESALNEEMSASSSAPSLNNLRGGRLLVQRGGSTRDYKRYSAGGEVRSSASTNDMAMDHAVNAEREEIERLNSVIASQRGVMSDLEASVAAWKGRLRLQNDIIARLVEAGEAAEMVAKDEKVSSLSSTSSEVTGVKPGSSPSLSSPPPPSSSLTRPYATGLGLGSTSPTKGVAWLATMPGVKADVLPLATGLLASPASARAKRRKTIEHEIQELKGSPRVKSTTNRLLESKVSRPLPVPGSPAKLRSSKDYYI